MLKWRWRSLVVAALLAVSGWLLPAPAAHAHPHLGAAPAAAEAPKHALCPVCAVMGGETEAEKVRATRAHEGVIYGFCSKDCAKEFDADPAAFVPPTLPRPAPAFALTTLEGDTLSLTAFRGGVTLLDFWATWCVPCRKSMPELSALHAAYEDRGFRVVGISIDEDRDEQVRAFVAETGVSYPIAIDRATDPAWNAYRVKAVPAAFLIDREGNIVAQWTGRTVDRAQLDALLEELLAAD